jgi:hypothetical protein|tara:strand:- start:623 stop:1027 length:405 start_codon:yes stop_codon:yes gene_type:complete
MAVVTTFTSAAQVTAKAGDGVNTALVAGTVTAGGEDIVEIWIAEGESDINLRCGYDWTTNFAAAPVSTKLILQGANSDYAAMYCVNYDKGGYITRLEAEGIINFLRDSYLRKLSLLKNKEKQKFIKTPSTGTID